jgi:histidinol phosphatase-like enzyme
MKVIFLDIDGVLALDKQFFQNRNKFHFKNPIAKELNIPYPWDKSAVKVFNKILEATDATIVLSSDWRIHWNLEDIGKIFEFNGVMKKPEFYTKLLKEFDESAAALFSWKGWLDRIR